MHLCHAKHLLYLLLCPSFPLFYFTSSVVSFTFLLLSFHNYLILLHLFSLPFLPSITHSLSFPLTYQHTQILTHVHTILYYFFTCEPRYPQCFYLRICLFTIEILIKNAKILVKMCLFICKFSIRGPKKQNVSTTNNEARLYFWLI